MGQLAILNSLGKIYGGSGEDRTELNITTQGDGSGVTNITIESYSETQMLLDGNARFYDDSNGTLNANTSRTILPGAIRTFYLKSNSGSSVIIFPQSSKIKKLGNIGDPITYLGYEFGFRGTSVNHPLISGFPNFKNVIDLIVRIENTQFDLNLGRLKSFKNLTNLSLNGNDPGATYPISMYGSIKDLPRGLRYIDGAYVTDIHGDIADFPRGLSYTYIEGTNTLSGHLSGIPPAANEFFGIGGNNSIYGNLSVIKNTNLKALWLIGNTTVNGDIGDLPDTIDNFWLGGYGQYTYKKRKTFRDNMFQASLYPRLYPMSIEEVDNLIIDVDKSTWNSDGYCWMYGVLPSPTSASAAARASLISKGVDTYFN